MHLCCVGRLRRRKSGSIAYVWAFGVAGDWKEATALEAEVWIETALEGWRRFTAAWRKVEEGAARHITAGETRL